MLQGKSAVVTGATSGIDLTILKALAAEYVVEKHPSRHYVTVEQVAALAVFLCGRRSSPGATPCPGAADRRPRTRSAVSIRPLGSPQRPGALTAMASPARPALTHGRPADDIRPGILDADVKKCKCMK